MTYRVLATGLSGLFGCSMFVLAGCDQEKGGGCSAAEEEMILRASQCDCGGDSGGGDGDGDGWPDNGGSAECSGIGEAREVFRQCECEPVPDPEAVPPPPGEEDETCLATEPVELHLSSDDLNSMSSPVQAREAVLSGWNSLSQVALRPWEFLNYYTFDYPAAAPGSVAVHLDLAEDPDAPGRYTMQIGVSSEAVTPETRRPANLTWVLDVSGSMSGYPLEMSKASLRAMTRALREGDIVSMVTWSNDNTVRLSGHRVSGPSDARVLGVIDGLDTGGGTDLSAGLQAGYELANANRSADRLNRVILISDGGANLGTTDADLIGANAGGQQEDGVYMVGVGVGSADTYHDGLMDVVTDLGKGASLFVPSGEEADRVFEARFANTLGVAARDIRVRLELPPGFALVRFSGEEWSEDPAEVEPQNIAPNDAMVFHQTLETCAPESITPDTEITVHVRYRDPITFEERETSLTRTFGEFRADPSPRFAKGIAVVAYTDALLAAKLGESPSGGPGAIQLARDAVDAAQAGAPLDPDLVEIKAVLDAL